MEYPNEIITVGSKNGVAIKAIKERLNSLGYAKLELSNPIFGPSTFAAVQNLQEKNQLKKDGAVGELTWQRLFASTIIQPISSKNLPERVMEWAKTQLFVRELTGNNDGKEVESYLATVGLGKGYSWCQAFLFAGYHKNAAELNVSNPMPCTAGVLNHRDTIRNRKNGPGKVLQPSQAKAGDIFIMDFHHNYEGHTGLIEEVRGSQLFTIEGNTNTDGSRNGNGVYERVREMRTIDCCIRY